MNQEELYKDLVYVCAADMNNTLRTIVVDGPAHDFEDLFNKIERMELLKNKYDPGRTDQIDLVKLGCALRIPMIFWHGDKIKCQ